MTKNKRSSAKSDKDQVMTLEVEKFEEYSSSMQTIKNEIDNKSSAGKNKTRSTLASNLMRNLQSSDKKSKYSLYLICELFIIEQPLKQRTQSRSSSKPKQLSNALKTKLEKSPV